jgi:hypothetical protein
LRRVAMRRSGVEKRIVASLSQFGIKACIYEKSNLVISSNQIVSRYCSSGYNCRMPEA